MAEQENSKDLISVLWSGADVLRSKMDANSPRAKYYEKNFFECQPALNYGFAHPDPNHPW